MRWDQRLILVIFSLIIGFALLTFLLAFFWRHLAFKYVFQCTTSGGLLVTAFYYFFRARVPNNVKKGLMFLVLSPVFFFLGELLFWPIHLNPKGLNDSNIGSVWLNIGNVLSTELKINPELRVWHFLVGFILFGNVLAIARNCKPRIFLAVNIIVFLGVIVIYVLLASSFKGSI